MAIFAVTEHNKRSNANLKLAQILSCRGFTSSITNTYALELLVIDGVDTKKYLARLTYDMITPAYKLQSFELTSSNEVTMKTNSLVTIIVSLFFLVAPLPLCAFAHDTATRPMNVILPLMNLDVDDPAVIEMAKFAIAEHNKRSNNGNYLKLAHILSGTGFADAIYSLELLATDGAITNKYLARLLHTKPNYYELQSFQLAPLLS
ncbi:hypothetical protein PIB30_004199 [Stylosanthes scabra]|uniref:Cystatin domain-containing protein n=1 Tax=Stylosanthes scabra TaxID=79078 RepID=A0ABU6R5R9_9FABA|nr:hypothetical protein [Stylosanthes scabra]